MDDRLKQAISIANENIHIKKAEQLKERETEAEKRTKLVESNMQAAQQWIDRDIFPLIQKAIEDNKNYLYLYGNSPYYEAIAKLVKKIDGLSIEEHWSPCDYENPYKEIVITGYSITWSK